jgi:hypothetical protein
MDAITYRIDQFEGPLDLLLTLIQKNKVSITDIPISLICDQYMEYITEAQRLDMDIAAEFAFKVFGMPTDFEDQYFKMRYVQYEWVRISLGNARSNAWFNSGIIYWMLNDCWPAAVGWSLLDYYTRPKAGFYAMKKFSGRENVYITRSDSGYLVNVSNIMEHDAELDLEIGVLNTVSNEYRELVSERISVPSGCLAYPIDFSLADGEMLIAEINNGDSLQRSQYKNSLPYLHKTDDIHWQVEEGTITVWSDKYIHAVEIECGDIIEDNYFSLLPGERRTVNIGNSEIKTVRAFTV